MTPAAILESALYVDDLDRAETFYSEVLGLVRIAKAEGLKCELCASRSHASFTLHFAD